MFRKYKLHGFTLIELMVVLVILGVLAALVVPNIVGRTDDARVTAARTDIAALSQALKLYRLDNGGYPTAAQGLAALTQKPSTAPVPSNWKRYVEKLPNDPWGRPYSYILPGIKGEFDVRLAGSIEELERKIRAKLEADLRQLSREQMLTEARLQKYNNLAYDYGSELVENEIGRAHV